MDNKFKNTKLSKSELVKKFVLKAIILFVAWKALFFGIIEPSGVINNYLTKVVASGTAICGELIGYESDTSCDTFVDEQGRMSCTVYLDNEASVRVADPCNGLELFALFVGFLICFPGPIMPKIVFSVLGTTLLFLVNILREITLAMNYLYFRSSFDFNHKYTYAMAVYAVVFLIWKLWLNRYSAIAPRNQPQNAEAQG